jgi:hypothetical protein
VSVAISTSPAPEDIVLLQESLFDWLMEKTLSLHPNEPQLKSRLEIGRVFNGISLDTICEEDRSEALALARAIHDGLLAATREPIPSHVFLNSQDAKRVFDAVASILDDFIFNSTRQARG